MDFFRLLANSRLSENIILRKTIHISGFLVPLIFVPLFNAYLVSAALFLTCIIYAASELARNKEVKFPVFSTVTQRAAKSSLEMNGVATAPVTFALGMAFSLLVFPPPIAYASIAVLTLGDGFACVLGKIFGKTPLFHNRSKTLEGSIGGFVCAFLGSILFVNPLFALVAVGVGMLVESIPFKFEDNLLIPLSSGMALMVFSFL